MPHSRTTFIHQTTTKFWSAPKYLLQCMSCFDNEQGECVVMSKELVMYSRRGFCPFVNIAKRVLDQYDVTYREIFIDVDDAARDRVLEWTGFLSVPTFVVAQPGEMLPYREPLPLSEGVSPRGRNRDTMITEPNADELVDWLAQHKFIMANSVSKD
ncbi:MAG: hypothetical protein CUN54_01850 [Phototrophicales bacterium]|nr:MAG: hypothetical protein CUN54_01850 [Phototrophicales bacterium]